MILKTDWFPGLQICKLFPLLLLLYGFRLLNNYLEISYHSLGFVYGSTDVSGGEKGDCRRKTWQFPAHILASIVFILVSLLFGKEKILTKAKEYVQSDPSCL